MIAMILGFVLGAFLSFVTNAPWLVVVGLVLLGVAMQVLYARRLNIHLGGADPVRTFGAKSLAELRTRVTIPVSIIVVAFLARMSLWGAGVAVLAGLGILRID